MQGMGFVLVHWFWVGKWFELILETPPLPVARWVLCFQRLLLLSVTAVAGPYDQCDRWKRNVGVAQSKASNWQ